jgi:hypothetical protein
MHSDLRHEPIRELVRRIRDEMGRAVPYVDPAGPGTAAEVIVILRDPGRLGALTTNLLSLRNPDATSRNQLRLFAEAELPIELCLWWNAVPWDLGGRAPKTVDRARGAAYLRELVALMRRPPVVVACGNDAHDACDRAGLSAIKICHPSSRGLYGGGVNREPAYRAGLRQAGRQVLGVRGSPVSVELVEFKRA